MKKRMKNVRKSCAACLTCLVISAIMLSGCGVDEEDAKAYVQATLDANCKGDFQDYIEITDKTEEDVKAMYDSNIETIMKEFETSELSEEEEENYRELFQDLFARANYTVKEAEKTEEGFTVLVETKKLIVFDDNIEDEVTEKCRAELEKRQTTPSEEEINEVIKKYLYEALLEKIENPEYGDKQEISVRVKQSEDGAWMIVEEDMSALDQALFM